MVQLQFGWLTRWLCYPVFWLLAVGYLAGVTQIGALAQDGPTDKPQTSAVTLPEVQFTSRRYIGPAGLTAEQLAEAAFTRSRELLAARQNLEIARGRLMQAGLRPNPTLDVEQTTDALTGRQGEGNMSFGVTQVFELGGKRSKRVAVAQLEYDRSVAEVRTMERQVAAAIRSAYAQALAAARQLNTAEQLIALDRELVRVTEARLKEGDVAPLDLNLMRVEVDRLRAQAVQSQADLEAQFVTLRTLAGFDLADSLMLAPALERPPSLELTMASALEMALRERADLQAARIAEELGDARLGLAQAQRTPNLATSVRYARSRSVFDNTPVGTLNDVDHLLTVGVSIEIPIRNRNQGEIAAAVSEKTQATYRREFVETMVKRDVALAFNRYAAAAQSLAIYGGQILPRAEQNLRTIRASYSLGEMPVMDVIAEQRRLVENQTQYNIALRDYYTSLAELERALGKPLPTSAFSSKPLTAMISQPAAAPISSKR